MSEDTKPKIEPLTEEELSTLIKKLEDDGDFESDLSRALFTIMVVGFEYQQLYTTLQAYYAAAAGACHDTAGTCAQIIGLRDVKKIQKMFKVAAIQAGNIPARAQALLERDPEEGTVSIDEESTNE
jgi:hypothetical protein